MKVIKHLFFLISSLLCTATTWAYDFSDSTTGTEIFYAITGSNTVEVVSKDPLDPFADSYNGDVEIPRTVTYDNVTYHVTSIGVGAFMLSQGLTSVIIPEGVTEIKGGAFQGCTSLASITIPDGITDVGANAFKFTPWYNNLPDGLFYIGDICYSYKGTVPSNAAINIADGTTKIAPAAFEGKSTPFSIHIPNSVISIGNSAFYRSGLTSINLPSTITTLEGRTFSDCVMLSSIDIRHITQIENYAFSGCTALASVDLPENVTLGVNVFEKSGLTSVTIPGGWNNTGDWTFYECKNLQSVIISEGVKTININTFRDCESLSAVSIPGSLEEIKNFAFYGCKGFASFTIPGTVSAIGSAVFSGCDNLTEFTSPFGYITSMFSHEGLPASLETVTITSPCTELAPHGFYNCNHLKEINLPEGLKRIGIGAFSGCTNLSSLTIPESVESIEANAFQDCQFMSIALPENVSSIGSYIFNGCTKLTGINIPPKITEIPNGAFQNCLALASVTIGGQVTRIGMHAFQDCKKLKYFPFPSGLQTIEGYAFRNCFELTDIDLPDGVASIGENAFQDCSKAVSVLIPGRLESLQRGTFSNCSGISTVTIPKNITSIGFYAFESCTGLQEITVEWETPLIVNENVFLAVPTSLCKLKVPPGTKEYYLEDNVWSTFMIEEYEPTSICPLTAGNLLSGIYSRDHTIVLENTSFVSIYDVSGRCIISGVGKEFPVQEKGLYIVKTDGITQKVLVND